MSEGFPFGFEGGFWSLSSRAIRRGCERNQCDVPSARKSILPDLARVEISDFDEINSTAARSEFHSSVRSRRAAVVVAQQPAENG